jgi:tRNA threonylcarbamoyladenosine biosynthesis protein TsaE
MTRDIKLPDAAATEALGAALAVGVAPGRVLHLRGDLGAGKTTVVRGVLRALGHEGKVKSPTYTLVEPYALSSLNLYHFDFYRLKNAEEWESSGFREYFGPQAACLVEWPERVGPGAGHSGPGATPRIRPAGRRASLSANTPAGQAWLSSLRLPA